MEVTSCYFWQFSLSIPRQLSLVFRLAQMYNYYNRWTLSQLDIVKVVIVLLTHQRHSMLVIKLVKEYKQITKCYVQAKEAYELAKSMQPAFFTIYLAKVGEVLGYLSCRSHSDPSRNHTPVILLQNGWKTPMRSFSVSGNIRGSWSSIFFGKETGATMNTAHSDSHNTVNSAYCMAHAQTPPISA